VRFENRIFYYILKKALAYYNAGVLAANSKVVGLAHGFNKIFPYNAKNINLKMGRRQKRFRQKFVKIA
jgi:hypothetical protein